MTDTIIKIAASLPDRIDPAAFNRSIASEIAAERTREPCGHCGRELVAIGDDCANCGSTREV